MELFEKKAHWAVLHYAERHGLLEKKYWKSITAWGKRNLPPLFMNARADEKALEDEKAFTATQDRLAAASLTGPWLLLPRFAVLALTVSAVG